MSHDDGAECRGQPDVGIDAVELAGFDQRRDDGPVLGTGIVTGEERIFSVERNRTDGPLDSIVVDLDAPIGQEQLEPCPVFGNVAQRFPDRSLRRDAGAMVIKPLLYPGNGWRRPLPARGEAVIGIRTSDIGFDGIEFADEPHALFGDRGSSRARDLNQLASGMMVWTPPSPAARGGAP